MVEGVAALDGLLLEAGGVEVLDRRVSQQLRSALNRLLSGLAIGEGEEVLCVDCDA